MSRPKGILFAVLSLLILAIAAQPISVASGDSAQRRGIKDCKRGQIRIHGKCRKRKPPKPEIRSGRYGGTELYIEVDTKARTLAFYFRQFCSAPYNSLNARSGTGPTTGFALGGTKPGTTVSINGAYTGPAENIGTQTTTWDMSGKFTAVSRFQGSLHLVTDIPPPNAQTSGAHCETTIPVDLR